MPSRYPVQTLMKLDHLMQLICGMSNEPLTAEEQRYHAKHGTYNGTSFSAINFAYHDIVSEQQSDINNQENMSVTPHSGDSLTGKGQKMIYIEDPEAVRKLDALFDKFEKRYGELRSKPSTGPLLTSLLDFTQSVFRDIKEGRDPFEEMNDDPVYHFTSTGLTDLTTPVPGSKDATSDAELEEFASYRFPLNRMVQDGLDVHRKIRDFRERIDPTDQEAYNTAKESLKKALDEYEKVTLRLMEGAASPSLKDVRARVMQDGTWNRDIIGTRGYDNNILPLIRNYKEGLELGIDPALLPQYSLIKMAHGQLDEAVPVLRDRNADGRYDEVLESAEKFRTAFHDLKANEDPVKSEQLMKDVCDAMNELFDKAGDAFGAHKNHLTPDETDAITLLRGSKQNYLAAQASFNTFRHITETVEKHYEKRHQLEQAAADSELRQQQRYLSNKALEEDRKITTAQKERRAANVRYYETNYFYWRKHKQSIEGDIYSTVFGDKRLFTEDFSFYYPRLAKRFPELADPNVAAQDKVSVLRSAAGHYLETLEEVLRKTSEKLIETRHFVTDGELLTDKKKIAELVSPDNTWNNPLLAYWKLLKDAREDLKNTGSMEEIRDVTRSFADSFRSLQEHHRKYQDPDIAAAINVQLDDAAGELKIFAGPSDYSDYFRRRVTAIGTHCRDKKQASDAAFRLYYYTQNWLDPDRRKELPLTEGDLEKLTQMSDAAIALQEKIDELAVNTVKVGSHNYLPTAIDPAGEITGRFLEAYDSLSPDMKAYCGNVFREFDANASLRAGNEDPIKNNYSGEDDLRLVSPENVDRFCKLSLEANEARSRVFDHQEFRDYRASLQAVSDYAQTVKDNPGSTQVVLHMAELMRAAGRAAETYLLEKGEGKRSSEVGNIRYNNAYAALYLSAPAEALTLAQTAKNLHVSAERTKSGEKREHLSLEALMKEEFGHLDRTYKKTANGQGYEKVQPAPEKHGKKK